jgi:phosphoribosylformylglycinamidine synthase
MDFKRPDEFIAIAGMTRNELGGSEYFRQHGATGNTVPGVNLSTAKRTMTALHEAMDKGLVTACHDCADGGIGVALAEMAFAGGIGAAIDLLLVPVETDDLREDYLLFSESNSRFLLTFAPKQELEIRRLLAGVPFTIIGKTISEPRLIIESARGTVVDEDISDLKEAWQAPLRDV